MIKISEFMWGISKKFLYNKFGIALFVIAIITHYEWFNVFSALTSGDWGYWSDQVISQLYFSYGSWINFFDFGSVNIQVSFNAFTLIWSLLTNLGFSYDLAMKVTFLIPIAILGFISPFLLLRKMVKNEFIAFIVALFYGTTTHFLVRQTAHLPIAFVYAVTPLVFYFFILALEKSEPKNWLKFILLFWVSICYEVRISYIVLFLLGAYFLTFYIQNIRKIWKMFFMVGVLISGLSFFWIFPTLFGSLSESIVETANRGIFGNNLFDLQNALTLSEPSWTGGEPDNNFVKQYVFWYFWFLPGIAFSAFFFKFGHCKYRKEILFFGIISLVGIFLTKQSDVPLSMAYQWLYEHFPGFNLFREASKFYLVTAFGYAGLIGFSLLVLKEQKEKILSKYLFFAFSSVIGIVAFMNLTPLITGEVQTMFVPRHIPSDYEVLKKFILSQSDYFRTFWVPESSRWGIYTNIFPKVSGAGIVGSKWKNFFENKNQDEKLIQKNIMNVFQSRFSNDLFDISSIKYVIVPIQDIANDDDFFIYYGEKENPNIREWYIAELDKIKWLEKIDIGTKELAVYENENYKPSIFAFGSLTGWDSLESIEEKYTLITDQLGKDFYFTVKDSKISLDALTLVKNLFENPDLGSASSMSGSIVEKVHDRGDTKNELYVTAKGDVLSKNIFLNGSRVFNGEVSLVEGENMFEYRNPNLILRNAIKNPSFENGVWQKEVGDCNAFDKNAILAMHLNNEEKTEGDRSLQLEATQHIACTSQKVSVKGGASYMFSFDYQSPNARVATYYFGFDDKEKTVLTENIDIKNPSWNTFSKVIRIPERATGANLFVYAYSTDGKTNIVNRYDNFKLIELPDISDRYYWVSEPKNVLKEPDSITFDLVNPTKKLVHIRGATTPFFLGMSESYHPQWQVQMNDDNVQGLLDAWIPFVRPNRIGDEFHYKLNDFLNGWHVDPEELCKNGNRACVKHADGSYDMEMVIEFFPQRWFYIGLLVSGATLVGCVGYLGYDWVRGRRGIKKRSGIIG